MQPRSAFQSEPSGRQMPCNFDMCVNAREYRPGIPSASGGRLEGNPLCRMWDTHRNQHGLGRRLHKVGVCGKGQYPLPLHKAMSGHRKDMDTLGTYGHEVTGDMQHR